MRTMFGILLAVSAAAALAQNAPSGASPTPEPSVQIEMETSRAQLTAGEGIGVSAEIKNLSAHAITLREDSVVLTVPPEMTGSFNDTRTWTAWFPTEDHGDEEHPKYPVVLTLQPRNSYEVFWTPTDARPQPPSKKATFSERAWLPFRNLFMGLFNDFGFVFFTPGDYKLTAQVKCWLTPSTDGPPYETAQKSTTVHVAAPQPIIMLGAILGGLMWYGLPQARRQRTTVTETPHRTRLDAWVGRIWQQTYGVLGTCFLSAIVTILLARLSDTQFLVKVTINDFWGAIAIGFVANYGGTRVLDRLMPTSKTKTTVEEVIPAAPGPPADEAKAGSAPRTPEAS